MNSGGAEGKHKQGVAQSAQRVVGEQILRKSAGSWLFTWEQENPSSLRLQGAAPRTQQLPDNPPTQSQPLLRSLSTVLSTSWFSHNSSEKWQQLECKTPKPSVPRDREFPSFICGRRSIPILHRAGTELCPTSKLWSQQVLSIFYDP